EEYRLVEVLKIPGVAWTITQNGKPAFLRQQEYELICRYLQTGLFIDSVMNPQDFEIGEKVKVIDGPLKGFSGVLTKKNSDTVFSVFIDTINYTLSIQLDNSLLQRIYHT
ncbi:MAG: transcription termination/antitermination protein NusG, partial [Cytophagales bacterium]